MDLERRTFLMAGAGAIAFHWTAAADQITLGVVGSGGRGTAHSAREAGVPGGVGGADGEPVAEAGGEG